MAYIIVFNSTTNCPHGENAIDNIDTEYTDSVKYLTRSVLKESLEIFCDIVTNQVYWYTLYSAGDTAEYIVIA